MKGSRRPLLSQLIYLTLRTAHCARTGAKSDGFQIVALHQRSLSALRMERVDRLCDELQTCANDPRGADGAKTFGRNHQRDRFKS